MLLLFCAIGLTHIVISLYPMPREYRRSSGGWVYTAFTYGVVFVFMVMFLGFALEITEGAGTFDNYVNKLDRDLSNYIETLNRRIDEMGK